MYIGPSSWPGGSQKGVLLRISLFGHEGRKGLFEPRHVGFGVAEDVFQGERLIQRERRNRKEDDEDSHGGAQAYQTRLWDFGFRLSDFSFLGFRISVLGSRLLLSVLQLPTKQSSRSKKGHLAT